MYERYNMLGVSYYITEIRVVVRLVVELSVHLKLKELVCY